MAIEITPSRVVRSADAVRDQGTSLLTTDPPDDPGNPGFGTSNALRSWRDRTQRESRELAASTTALADRLQASAIAITRAEEENARAAASIERFAA